VVYFDLKASFYQYIVFDQDNVHLYYFQEGLDLPIYQSLSILLIIFVFIMNQNLLLNLNQIFIIISHIIPIFYNHLILYLLFLLLCLLIQYDFI